MREQWKEPASGEKRGAAIKAVFYLEDENGQRLERTQKGLVEIREIMDEEMWKKYLEIVLTKTSARCKPENRALAQRFVTYEDAIRETMALLRPDFSHLCQDKISKDEAFFNFFIKMKMDRSKCASKQNFMPFN